MMLKHCFALLMCVYVYIYMVVKMRKFNENKVLNIVDVEITLTSAQCDIVFHIFLWKSSDRFSSDLFDDRQGRM